MLDKLFQDSRNIKEQDLAEQEIALLEIIRAYWEISSLPELSDNDVERMVKILNLAQFDEDLNYWINQVDNMITSELGCLESNFEVNQWLNKRNRNRDRDKLSIY